MYEEVDECYQAKRILKLQTQKLHIKERFYRHLLIGFPSRPVFHSNGPSIASRRASKLASRASFSGNPQSLRLDLSNINSSFSHGPPALASAMATADIHKASPNTPFDPDTPSCIACKSSLETPYTILDPPPSAATSGQMCAYIPQQLSAPLRNTTAKYREQMPTSDQSPYVHPFRADLAASDDAPDPGSHRHRHPTAKVQEMPRLCSGVVSAAPGSAAV